MKVNALKVFEKLLDEDKLLEIEGQIKFFLGDVDIIVKQKDVVGNIIQVKQGVVHKIRPGVWYSDRPGNIPMFKCIEDCIAAIEEAVYQNPKTHESAATWKKNFIDSYRKFYGVKLDIPRWQEIAPKYE